MENYLKNNSLIESNDKTTEKDLHFKYGYNDSPSECI